MLHKFKFASNRFAFDSASGALHSLDELGYKMLDYLVLPMAPDCPSALRYDLAKYDSEAISDTYDEMLAKWKAGELFAPDEAFEKTEPTAVTTGAALTETDDGLVIEASDKPLDIEAKCKELDKAIKASLKAGSGSIFAPVKPFEHSFACCEGCFARALCSLANPGEQVCELERKRIECELAANKLASEA